MKGKVFQIIYSLKICIGRAWNCVSCFALIFEVKQNLLSFLISILHSSRSTKHDKAISPVCTCDDIVQIFSFYVQYINIWIQIELDYLIYARIYEESRRIHLGEDPRYSSLRLKRRIRSSAMYHPAFFLICDPYITEDPY